MKLIMLSDKCVCSVIEWLNNSNKKIGKKNIFFEKKFENRKKNGPTFSRGSGGDPRLKVLRPGARQPPTWTVL